MEEKINIIITGVCGQDGYFLSKQLLNEGFNVIGLDQWQYKGYKGTIKELMAHENFKLIEGDITDRYLIRRLLKEYQPKYFFNTAAISHVGVSFQIPERVTEVNYLAVLNMLEEIRAISPDTGFLQCSTSEQFGDNTKIPQDENSAMMPNSPYAIAKTASYYIVKLYRNYGIRTYNTICFNHESVPKESSVTIKHNNRLKILPIGDLFYKRGDRFRGFRKEYKGSKVWDGEQWTKIVDGTCYQKKNKPMKLIQTRDSCYEATLEHKTFLNDNSGINTEKIKKGDFVFETSDPIINKYDTIDNDLSYIIGFIVGDGYISKAGYIRLTGCNKSEISDIANIIKHKFGWEYRTYNSGPGNWENCKNDVYQIDFNNDPNFGLWLKNSIYSKNTNKKIIPEYVLNGTHEIRKSFFKGYYLADGRKSGHEKYEYKGFTTNSQALCMGLNYICKMDLNQIPKTKCIIKGDNRYYYTQLRSPKTNIGKGAIKKLNEVISVKNTKNPDNWFFDIQTESKAFATGPNTFKVHNSEIRPENFVTRKITKALTEIKKNGKGILTLGNIDTSRDWGYAPDYTRAMIDIVKTNCPNDYVLCTEETHTVREFIEASCHVLDFKLEWKGKGLQEVGYIDDRPSIFISEEFYRPAEVTMLMGSAHKIETILGWKPETTFYELVEKMVEHDLK